VSWKRETSPNAKEIAMQTDITHNLPKVIADHIAACNTHDVEAWMATFAPDAMLNDIQREFLGAEAIRDFADAEIFGTNVTMDVQRAWDRHGDVTVHARLDGTYDKTGLPDPLILSFYFTLRGGRITQLIIIHNKSIV
jgi:ketosteroid isomerase-like protein